MHHVVGDQLAMPETVNAPAVSGQTAPLTNGGNGESAPFTNGGNGENAPFAPTGNGDAPKYVGAQDVGLKKAWKSRQRIGQNDRFAESLFENPIPCA